MYVRFSYSMYVDMVGRHGSACLAEKRQINVVFGGLLRAAHIV